MMSDGSGSPLGLPPVTMPEVRPMRSAVQERPESSVKVRRESSMET
jgi:hypothetical protein